MMKNIKLFAIIISLSIMIILIMLLFKNLVVAEELIVIPNAITMSPTEALNILKDVVYDRLYSLIRQPDFRKAYEQTWIYSNIILKENFLKNFIDTMPWEQFCFENKALNSQEKLDRIISLFKSYVDEVERAWISDYLKRKEQAYENTFNKTVELIINDKTIKFIRETAPWMWSIFILAKMYNINEPFMDFPLAISDNPLIYTMIDVIITKLPQLSYLTKNDAMVIIPIHQIKDHIITPGVRDMFLNSNEWISIVSHHNTTVAIIGVFSAVVVFIKIFFL
jgi:hypothetical protein